MLAKPHSNFIPLSVFHFLALTSGPWDVLPISWWLVYHLSELGEYYVDVNCQYFH